MSSEKTNVAFRILVRRRGQRMRVAAAGDGEAGSPSLPGLGLAEELYACGESAASSTIFSGHGVDFVPACPWASGCGGSAFPSAYGGSVSGLALESFPQSS
jgi:hypothetical protein